MTTAPPTNGRPPAPSDTAQAGRRIRVLVADDHAIVRGGIVLVIGDALGLAVVAEAADGTAAVDLYAQHRPDVALIDLKMPRLDGVGVVTAIRSRYTDARLVILTTYDADDDVERALKAGAKGYLLKDVAPDELVSCVRAVHQGRTWVSPAVATRLAERLTRAVITPREMAVLRELAAGRSNKEIAAALTIAEGTAKIHAARLYEKLGVSSRTEAVAVALQRGLVRIPDRP